MRRLLLLAVLTLTACTTTKYVPMEQVRTEYVDRVVEQVRVDSVTDTRFVYINGDTIREVRDRWHLQREVVHDTLLQERVDSIPYAVEVPAKLTAWEQTKVNYGGYAMATTLFIIITAIILLILKLRFRL